MRSDGMLDMRPAPEIEMLRGRHFSLSNIELADGAISLSDSKAELSYARGDTLELIVEFDLGDATEVGVIVRCSSDRREQTRLLYERSAQHLIVDTSQSSLDDSAHLSRHAGPLTLISGETLRLHLFLDRSVVEVFANERSCATARIYPTLADSKGISVFAHGGTARLVSLDAWEMQSIWAEAE